VVTAAKTEAATGEPVPLSIGGIAITDTGGCAHDTTTSTFAYPTPIDRYWSVTPVGGAKVSGGVFRATRPGTYNVSFADGKVTGVQAAVIVVIGEEVAGETSATTAPINPLVGTWTWETRYAQQHWTKKTGVDLDKWDWKPYAGEPRYAFELRGGEMWVMKVPGANPAPYAAAAKVEFDGTNVSFTMKQRNGKDLYIMECKGVLTVDRIDGTVSFDYKPAPPLHGVYPRTQGWVATRVD
jgi:hypothetical protein